MTNFARLVLVSDTSDLKATRVELNQLTRAGDQTERKLNAATAKMGAGFKRAAIAATAVVSALASVGVALRASQEITRVTNGFRAMGLSAEQAQAALREVAGIAERTRAPLAATAELYRRVTVAGRDLGASQSDVARFTENVGLALGAAGTPANEAAGALFQLSQAMAGGTVRAEEFNSILEGAFPIAQAAANGIDGAAGSVGRLRQMVVEGEVSSKAFFEAIISQSDALQESFNQTEVTIAQATTGLGNAFALLASETDQAFGISSGIASGIEFLADNLEIVRGAVLGTAAVVTGMYLSAIVSADRLTLAWVASLVTLRGVLIATGVGALIVAAGTLIDFLLRLRTATGSWGEALSALGDLAAGVWEGIVTSASAIGPGLSAIWQDIQSGFFNLLSRMTEAWSRFLGGLGQDLAGVSVLGVNPFQGVSDSLLRASGEAVTALTEYEGKATSAAGAAARFREENARLRTEGFDKAREALARLNEIMAGGKDTTTAAADEAAKLAAALEDIGGKAKKAADGTKEAAEAAKKLEQQAKSTSDSFASLFVGILDGSQKASDALREMGLNLLKSGISGLFQSSGIFKEGGFLGNIAGLFAGAFDSGGRIGSGQFGIVGERGPEIVTGPANVTSRVDTARMMNGNTQIEFKVVNNRSGNEVTQRRERGPDGRTVLIAEINEAATTGQLDRGFGSRFGAQPQKARR